MISGEDTFEENTASFPSSLWYVVLSNSTHPTSNMMLVQVAVPRPTAIRAKALYSFGGRERGELGFKKGEFINIVDTSIDWWVGEIGNRQGRFPHYHVVSSIPFFCNEELGLIRCVV